MQFTTKKVNGLLGLTTVATQVDDAGKEAEVPFQISADKMGMWFSGPSIRFTSMEDLDQMAQAVDAVWRAYQIAKPKILNERGH